MLFLYLTHLFTDSNNVQIFTKNAKLLKYIFNAKMLIQQYINHKPEYGHVNGI